MKTEITFGGAPFTIPLPIGSGIGARIAQESAELKRSKIPQYEEPIAKARMQALARQAVEELLNSEENKKLPGLTSVVLNRIAPILPAAYADNWLQENYPYDYTLLILRNILTPGSEVTAEQAFDEASEAEVQGLISFFTANAGDKTKTGASKTSGTRSSKGTRKPKH